MNFESKSCRIIDIMLLQDWYDTTSSAWPFSSCICFYRIVQELNSPLFFPTRVSMLSCTLFDQLIQYLDCLHSFCLQFHLGYKNCVSYWKEKQINANFHYKIDYASLISEDEPFDQGRLHWLFWFHNWRIFFKLQ